MKREKYLYGMMALLMCVLVVGMLMYVEQRATMNLFAALMFCAVCSGILLFCLMKMGVMEFRQGTFWYKLNQRIQRKNTRQRRKNYYLWENEQLYKAVKESSLLPKSTSYRRAA